MKGVMVVMWLEGLTSTGNGGEVRGEADKLWQLLIPSLAGAA